MNMNYKTFYAIFLALALIVTPANSQDANKTSGACSPIVGTNQGTVTIECSGLSQEVSEQIIQILNKILASQVDQQAVLKQLNELSKGYDALASRSIDAQRGVTSIYDFSGVRREQPPGSIRATVGPETIVFQQMRNLESQKQWPELIALGEKQISKTPKWLTPYLFAAEGYIQLGQNSNALERLEYVARNAGNDPEYQIAGQWIARLKGQQ
jgi:hypothetical protein